MVFKVALALILIQAHVACPDQEQFNQEWKQYRPSGPRSNAGYRGGRVTAWSSRGSGRSHSFNMPQRGEGGENQWGEERALALQLEQKVIRKISMKRWIQERHDFWPSRPSAERLKVEEMEAQREAIFTKEGWPLPCDPTRYARAKKTRWEKLATRETLRDTEDHQATEASPHVQRLSGGGIDRAAETMSSRRAAFSGLGFRPLSHTRGGMCQVQDDNTLRPRSPQGGPTLFKGDALLDLSFRESAALDNTDRWPRPAPQPSPSDCVVFPNRSRASSAQKVADPPRSAWSLLAAVVAAKNESTIFARAGRHHWGPEDTHVTARQQDRRPNRRNEAKSGQAVVYRGLHVRGDVDAQIWGRHEPNVLDMTVTGVRRNRKRERLHTVFSRWVLLGASCGTFSDVTLAFDHGEGAEGGGATVLALSGPWEFTEVDLRSAGGTALGLHATSSAHVTASTLGGLDSRPGVLAWHGIRAVRNASCVLQETTVVACAQYGALVRDSASLSAQACTFMDNNVHVAPEGSASVTAGWCEFHDSAAAAFEAHALTGGSLKVFGSVLQGRLWQGNVSAGNKANHFRKLNTLVPGVWIQAQHSLFHPSDSDSEKLHDPTLRSAS